MSAFCRHPHRIGLERAPRTVTTAADALAVIHMARSEPPTPQVIVLVLHDRARIVVRCERPLPLQADGEDLGDVEQAVFEAEPAAVTALVP